MSSFPFSYSIRWFLSSSRLPSNIHYSFLFWFLLYFCLIWLTDLFILFSTMCYFQSDVALHLFLFIPSILSASSHWIEMVHFSRFLELIFLLFQINDRYFYSSGTFGTSISRKEGIEILNLPVHLITTQSKQFYLV